MLIPLKLQHVYVEVNFQISKTIREPNKRVFCQRIADEGLFQLQEVIVNIDWSFIGEQSLSLGNKLQG